MAAPFTEHKGIAAPLLVENIDTDQIIPSREMRTTGRSGLAKGLFAGWRYTSTDAYEPDPAFILNQPEYASASILIAGANFGCGSSREHAVWALAEFGIRAVIAESFGEIFYQNTVRNGIAAITVTAVQRDQLVSALADAESGQRHLTINLPDQTISTPDICIGFDFDVYDKRLLVGGLDPISLTLRSAEALERFLMADKTVRPWVYN